MTRVLPTLLPAECLPFRFAEVCWATTSDYPVLLIDCRFVNQVTFANMKLNIPQVSLSPPTLCWPGESVYEAYLTC